MIKKEGGSKDPPLFINSCHSGTQSRGEAAAFIIAKPGHFLGRQEVTFPVIAKQSHFAADGAVNVPCVHEALVHAAAQKPRLPAFDQDGTAIGHPVVQSVAVTHIYHGHPGIPVQRDALAVTQPGPRREIPHVHCAPSRKSRRIWPEGASWASI